MGSIIAVVVVCVVVFGPILVVGLLLRAAWLGVRRLTQPVAGDAAPVKPSVAHTPRGLLFLSYRRSDSADITGRLYDRLREHFGRDCVFRDVDSIPLGIDFVHKLREAVAGCDVLVAVIGVGWLDARDAAGQRRIYDPRDHLRIELETALERNIPVIPVLVQGMSMPAPSDLPETLQPLASRNGLTVRADPDFQSDIDRLSRGIEAHFTAVGNSVRKAVDAAAGPS